MQIVYRPDEPEYQPAAALVFTFLRHCSEGRYSSRTMMRLVTQAEHGQAPLMVVDSEPTEIDRLTEVKRGGIRTAAAVLRDGRVLLATHSDFRGQGYGAAMVNLLIDYLGDESEYNLQFWIHPDNTDAARFLIAQGLTLTATTPNPAALCYGMNPQFGSSWPH